ncbi:MAG TPA: MmcQ/YjbR family DNA-binding protein [Candidatus Binataceae bacterium]|nr:MmcQ/YjbR family DNA-binding protein [Candidatus Binataceae bacterium]
MKRAKPIPPARRASRGAGSESPAERVRRIALTLPGVEVGSSYGTMGFRVRKKFLGRMKEDGETLVIRIEFGEREILCEGEPEVFYFTEHYRNYPAVLVRLARVDDAELRRLFEQAWRRAASKKQIAELEAS